MLAGTLRALSTVRGVTVKHSTYQGVKTLDIALWLPKTVANYPALKRSLEAKIRANGGHPTARQKALLQKLDAAAVSKVVDPGALRARNRGRSYRRAYALYRHRASW